MASYSSTNYQYLDHDWATQLTMLKVMYDVDDLKVKYIDDENEEIGLNNPEEYKQAIQFASKHSNNLLKLVLKNSRGDVVAKPTFKIDTNDKDLLKLIQTNSNTVSEDTSKVNANQTSVNVLETDILASLPNEKKNWLVNYLEQLKKDIVHEMETKIKDIVLTQSTVLLTSTNETETPKTNTDLLDMDVNLYYEEKIKKLINLLTEARLSERPIKVAFIEEELQLSGALNAVFVKDLTMPDGTKCSPGMRFHKKWLIKNTGRLAWSTGEFPVKLVCLAGNIQTQNGDYVSVGTTNVDATTIIGVDLVAPLVPGEYFSEWVLVCNGFKFGPRIWASIEVVSEPEDASSYQHQQSSAEASTSESLDDEFVVVPACFDLNKDWKSECASLRRELSMNLESSVSKQEEVKTREDSLESVESVNTAISSRSVSSQPVDILVKQTSSSSDSKSEEIKSPSSFSSLNGFKDALSNVKMPSYVGDFSAESNSNESAPKPLVETQTTITTATTTTSTKSIISPVSSKIANVSKTMYSAIGSLGSVYQSGESYMDKLISMGFANRALNNQLLKKHNNNLDKVISELLETQETNFRL